MCDRLGISEASRTASRQEALFGRWRSSISSLNVEFANLLLKATIFRRWSLAPQTSLLSRLILRDQLEAIELELSGEISP